MPAITLSAPPRVSPREAAALGFAGYSTLLRRIAAGELPAERNGRSYLIRLSDLGAMVPPAGGRPTELASDNAAIDRLVASAPRLSPEQRERLAVVLGGGAA